MLHKEIDIYIDCLPEELREVATTIREMLFNLIPNIEERYSFRIPFYHYYGMFCYLTTLRGKRLHFTFLRGNELSSVYPQLEAKGRALAASVSFGSMKDFNKDVVSELIMTAAIWQKEAFERGDGFIQKKAKKQP